MRDVLISAAISTMLLTIPASAKSAACTDSDSMKKVMSDHGMSVEFTGMKEDRETSLKMYVNNEKGLWFMVLVNEQGYECMLDSGYAFKKILP